MSDQSTQNATPTVQVREVGLPEQASVAKVLAVAGAAGAAVAAVMAALTEKEETPPTKTESARAYLQSALNNAQDKDIAKVSRRERKKSAKNLKRGKKKAGKNAEMMMEQARLKANDSASMARGEFNSFLNTLKGGGMELERLAEEFAESTLMGKLREFGEEARVIAEQGKVKSAEAAHKAQSDLLPQAKEAARHARDVGKERAAEVADKAKVDLIPAAQQMKADLTDKAKNDFIPTAQKVTADVKVHAREVTDVVSHDAEKLLHDAADKSKQAGTAVQRGGRETRSFLLWLSLAGILIFTVFLDEDQQKKLKEVAVEVFGEARDMYGDMKGDTQAK